MKYTILIVAVVLALFCRLFLVSVYKVSSQTMAPALITGDFLLASKISYGFNAPWAKNSYFGEQPGRGDLVVFRKNSKIYIKRVLAVARDEVEYANGEYAVNSIKCMYGPSEKIENDSYSVFEEKCGNLSYKIIKLTDSSKSIQMAKIKLDEFQMFVASDYRNFESDLNTGEVISGDQIIGKPLFVWMSYSSTQDFISKALGIRWNRILTKLN